MLAVTAILVPPEMLFLCVMMILTSEQVGARQTDRADCRAGLLPLIFGQRYVSSNGHVVVLIFLLPQPGFLLLCTGIELRTDCLEAFQKGRFPHL